MKQALLVRGGAIEIQDVPAPANLAGGAVTATLYSAISPGTELAAVSGGGSLIKRALTNPELITKVFRKLRDVGAKSTLDLVKSRLSKATTIGYSACGEVVEVADLGCGVTPGQRVAVAGVGYASHAEYNWTPKNLMVPVPDDVSSEAAAFTTIGAIALQGVRRLEPTLGETVLVQGLGLIGQLAVRLLLANGCRVLATDFAADRLAVAADSGAETFPAADGPALEEWLAARTAGRGIDGAVSCVATTSPEPLHQAFRACRPKGRVVVVGTVGMDAQRDLIYRKELDLRISCSYGPGRYDPAYEEGGADYPLGYVRWSEQRNMAAFLDLQARGRLSVADLITHRFPIADAAETYRKLSAREVTGMGLVFEYGARGAPESRRATVEVRDPAAGKIGWALVGAGSYATAMLVPHFQKAADLDLRAVQTRSGHNAAAVAKSLGAAAALTEIEPILEDESIDFVAICTRHDSHADLALRCLRAGKRVFVEKPLCLTLAEADALDAQGGFVSVGFNRRFSPYAVRLKELLDAAGDTPKQIVYRGNPGPLKDHWSLAADQGGRVLGECVHFLDFACFLASSEPVAVTGAAVPAARTGTPTPDAFSCQIAFANGDLATVIYAGQGHKGLPKERVEVFQGGRAFVLDDFRALEVYGAEGALPPGEVDKGQEAMVGALVDALAGRGPLRVDLADGTRATRLALRALAREPSPAVEVELGAFDSSWRWRAEAPACDAS